MPKYACRMLPGGRLLCVICSFALLISYADVPRAQTKAPSSDRVFVTDGMGLGAVALDGPWQFHLGDDMAWADSSFDDSSWEQIRADRPWGAQSHRSYTGFAWYRRHIMLSPAAGATSDFALLVPAIDDVYEIYWNGELVGHLGSMPPDLLAYANLGAQTFGLGPVRTGVLAVRVFKLPLGSTDDGSGGGFEAMPIIGSSETIASTRGALDYRWLRGMQFRYGLTSMYSLVALFCLFVWFGDRKQMLLLWMGLYACSLLLEMFLFGSRMHEPATVLGCFRLVTGAFREISLWFILLWLLRLNENLSISRLVRAVALFCFTAVVLDSLLSVSYPFLIGDRVFQIADAALTALYVPTQLIVLFLVGYAIVGRKRLDPVRWVVAIFAFLNSTLFLVINAASQGIRFTHWTLSHRLTAPVLELNGNPITAQFALRALLFLSLIYAVFRYAAENRRRQSRLEQEFMNARALQQVLIPESQPEITGFMLTSAYKPALEVGGDFFQVIPLEAPASSTLVVLGDVSGKGLKAAMAVSLIVGATRMAAEATSSPAAILAALNRRLEGRLNGGFATCVAMRLDPDGACTLANAGHPAPYLNGSELILPGALPLGISNSTSYQETGLRLKAGDRLALYTDGLLEARSPSGELYSFTRMQALFATNPTAAQATEAAIQFGQDDDITVLILTRLEVGDASTAHCAAPVLSPM
jgi:Stage II sporulation protein E (SpoIIE)